MIIARLIYYLYCLPDVRPTTGKMELGQEAHDKEQERAARRSLNRYGLSEGETLTNLYLESEKLGLRGKVDLCLKTNDNPEQSWELIPVDYKLTTHKMGHHFQMQLLAYGLLLQEKYGLLVRRGFLYAIPTRKATEIKFTEKMKATLQKEVAQMQKLTFHEQMPDATTEQAKCGSCEFRRFCNDVF